MHGGARPEWQSTPVPIPVPRAGVVAGPMATAMADLMLVSWSASAPGCDTGDAGDARCGIASTVPARIAFGSEPISRRLAAYSAGQPPAVPSAEAMPESASPAATV